MNHPIPARIPDLIIINKKKITYHLVDFDIACKEQRKNKIRWNHKQISGSC